VNFQEKKKKGGEIKDHQHRTEGLLAACATREGRGSQNKLNNIVE